VSASSYGSYLADNPYRFSTKPFDDETGLGYWGYRYYSARLGRWFNRDPRSEQGGLNLYQYVQNSVPNAVDPLGLWKLWGHKEITEEAYKNLSCRHSLGCCGDNILIGLKRGVVWTDAPDGVVDLAISYLFGTKNSLAWRTHWGDLVHWHATVGNETTPEQLRQKMLDWIDTNLFLFENTSQPDPPLDEDKALRCVDKYDYIGRFLHTIQDSYSRSHTTRAPDGTILLFQDYKEQDPDKHGVADKDKGSPEWNSAVKATRTILEMLLCSKSSRGDVIAWIRDNPLRLHPDVRLGGTEDEFKPGTNPDDIVIHGP
jgi:RHS repeat-associated protein